MIHVTTVSFCLLHLGQKYSKENTKTNTKLWRKCSQLLLQRSKFPNRSKFLQICKKGKQCTRNVSKGHKQQLMKKELKMALSESSATRKVRPIFLDLSYGKRPKTFITHYASEGMGKHLLSHIVGRSMSWYNWSGVGQFIRL